jgi:hypothetical protein
MTILLRRLALLFFAVMLAGCLSDQEPGGSDLSNQGSNAGRVSSNSPPTISGSPAAAVLVGDVYSFTPTATDSDGDPLTYSVSNLPRWATFDTSTGKLSGQVTLGDDGVYRNIRISVSDGNSSASLRDFSVTVTSVGLGSMTLTWNIPTENSDGTPLLDLAGFYIYYGLSWGNYSHRVRIDNPSISTYLVENLLPDTYYVTATSFNSRGVESTFSNVAVKTVTGD